MNTTLEFIEVFPKWSNSFIEFSDFSNFSGCDKSLKHELDSIWRSCLWHVSCWCCGSILVSYTRGGWVASSSPFTEKTNNSVKTFKENSNMSFPFMGNMLATFGACEKIAQWDSTFLQEMNTKGLWIFTTHCYNIVKKSVPQRHSSIFSCESNTFTRGVRMS